MTMMAAAKRDRRVAFQRPIEVRGALGGLAATSWQLLGFRLANVRWGSSAERREAAGADAAVQAATFRVVRDGLTRTLTARDRVVFADLAWDVTGAVQVGRDEIEITATASREAAVGMPREFALGMAVESDSAFALASVQICAVGMAVESDSAFELPWWVPAGALIHADFANGRYWRSDIGICGFDDINDADLVANWWGGTTLVTAGVGLTTGEVSSGNNFSNVILNAAAFAVLDADGYAALMTLDIPSGSGKSDLGAAVTVFDEGFDDNIGFEGHSRKDGVNRTFAIVGGGDPYSFDNDAVAAAAVPVKVAGSVSFSGKSVISSADGSTGATATLPTFDAAEVNRVVVNTFATLVDVPVTATLGSVTFYAQMDQTALNALTSSYDLAFMGGVMPVGTSLARASAGSVWDDAGTLQLAAVDEPRFDHHPVTNALRGLLLEPAATNLALRSQEIDNAAWSLQELTVSANAGTAPDGSATLDLLTLTTANDAHRAYRATTALNDTAAAFSAFVKANGTSKLGIRESATTGAGAAFDLAAEAVIGAFNAAGSTVSNMAVEDCGGGIYHIACGIEFAAATAMNFGIHALPAGYVAGQTIFQSFAGDGSSGFYLWGAQLEAGLAATSYIPTTGSTATRAADELTITVPAGVTTAHCTIEGGSADVPVSEGPQVLTAADFGGVPVWLQGITFS